MCALQADGWTRRRFLGGLTVTGAVGLLGLQPRPVAAEPPPEPTTLRLDQRPSICAAPQYVAEELLQGEGFTNARYVPISGTAGVYKALASGEIDITLAFVGPSILRVDVGDAIVFLAGGHVGRSELS